MADITAGGLCPFFFNVLPFSFASPSVTPSPPFPVFFFSPLPDSPQRTQQPCLQDPSCPHLCSQTRTGETLPPAQDPACWVAGGFQFLISTSPSEGRRWSGGPTWISGLALTGSLPLRCCRPRRLPSAGPPGGRHSIVGLPSKPAVRLQVSWPGGCPAASPHGGRKAIMSRDRCGLWELQEQRPRASSSGWGPGTLWGIWRGPLGGHCPSTPHAAPWPCGQGRRNIWGWPPLPPAPCLTRASFQLALPPAGPGPGLGPSEDGGRERPFSLPGVEQHQPRLLHISHRDSIGPRGLGSKRGRGWCLQYVLGWGPGRRETPGHLTPSPSLILTFCSLKVNVSVLWALVSVPRTVCL